MKRLLLLLVLSCSCDNGCDNVSIARCVEHCESVKALPYGAKINTLGYCTCTWNMKDLAKVKQ